MTKFLGGLLSAKNALLRRLVLIVMLGVFVILMILGVLFTWVILTLAVIIVTPYFAVARAWFYTCDIFKKLLVSW